MVVAILAPHRNRLLYKGLFYVAVCYPAENHHRCCPTANAAAIIPIRPSTRLVARRARRHAPIINVGAGHARAGHRLPIMPAELACFEKRCRARYPITEVIYNCPACGGLLEAVYEKAAQPAGELKTL